MSFRENKAIHLFLDFDGVLVTKFSPLSTTHPGLAFDPVSLEVLRQFLQRMKEVERPVILVITSNWQSEMNRSDIRRMLAEDYELLPLVMDTRFLYARGTRAQAIKDHLDKCNLDPEDCLILDDEDLGTELAHRQIRPRTEDGLRGTDADTLASYFSVASGS